MRHNLGRLSSAAGSLGAVDQRGLEHTHSSPTASPLGDLLVTRSAIAYTGRSRSTLNRAVIAGLLPVAGRVGGVGERVFRRCDLDAWLLGKSAEPAVGNKPQHVASVRAVDVEPALERIRRAAGRVS